MSKHTPGPWIVARDGDALAVWADYGNRETICKLPAPIQLHPDAEANARLIAKTPAMHELLRQAIDAFGPAIEAGEDINGADTVDWICMFVQAAKNVIEPV